MHHVSEAGRFYTIAESLALHDTRYARLKERGYAHVFNEVEQIVVARIPSLAADQRKRMTRVLVALIDGASLQAHFGQASAPVDRLDALVEDVAAAIVHLTETWR